MKNANTSNKAYSTSTSTSSDAWDAINYLREEQNEEATQAYDNDFFSNDDEDDDMECRVFI